jgi:glutamyl-tRNA reductase
MARAAAESLVSRGARVRVLNRTPAHAERVFAHMPIEVGALAALPQALRESSLIVGATASRVPVVSVDDLVGVVRDEPLVLLDIALPRDIDPRVRELPNIRLIDLDDLERLCPVDSPTRRAEQERAEELAVEETERLLEWLRFREVSPAIAELRTYAEQVRTGELRRSAARLRDLTPEQIAAVEALTSGIVNKLMHGPTVALREAAPGRTHSRILRLVAPSTSRGRSSTSS